jgi:PEGA domain
LQKGLSKQPDARYPNCTELVEALETACAATPEWKSLGRGASLNLPTMAETAPPPPPKIETPPVAPAPQVRNLPAPHVREEPEKKSRVVPMMVTLAVGCALAIGVYYASQSIGQEPPAPASPVPATAKTEPKKEEPPSKPTPRPPEPTQEEEKPAPPPSPVIPKRAPVRPRLVTSVEIAVRSQPSDATVTLDGLPGTACITPCVLKASTGEHTISVSRAGYKTLLRAITVRDEPIDLPVLTLAQAVGFLMVQSEPAGAIIMIDDKRWPSVTPAQVSLPPGRYHIAVEKGVLRAVQTIEVHDGDLRRLLFVLSAQ